MSKKQWMVLLMLFLTYLLLGASIFYHIESRLEIEHIKKAKQERIEINALLHKHYIPSQSHDYDEILGKLTRYCGKSVYNYTEEENDPLKWDFYNSFYFAYTVVSTIGYGNLAPTNMLSRILMIFYGLVGIPMNGILLSQLGEFFSHVFVRAHRKYKSYKHGRDGYYPKKVAPFETRKVGLAAQIFAYLTPGFVMFIFFPAFLFSHYEGWAYDEAVYYAFVTLTTIGFGDYVAGQDNSKGSGILFILYKAFLICWISFGLGYIVMIMTFIARGMRSKKITRIEHKLAINLKHTQSKIWNEFNKEINYLRRVFNELQLSKVKRVYVDECEYEIPPTKLSRSNSFPNIRDLSYGGHAESSVSQRPRRRANSEVVPMEDQVVRVVSETDLQRIDKTATFAAHAMVQPAELLARLVNILGYIPPSDDIGDPPCREREVDRAYVEQESRGETVNGEQGRDPMQFDTWKNVLKKRAISTGSPWAIGNERIPQSSRPRSRAASEVRLYEARSEAANAHHRNVEWTWSGPAASKKIQELITARTTAEASVGNAKDSGSTKSAKYRTLALAKSVPRALFPRWRRQLSSGKKTSDHESGSSKPTDKDDTEKLDERRDSFSRKLYYTHTGANTTSSLGEGSHLLEETSLADFLRALTVLHASVGTVPDEYAYKPRRKMGTASLSPPKLPSLFTLFSSPPPTGTDGSTTQSNHSTITGTERALRETSRRLSLGPTDFNKNFDGFSASALRPRMQGIGIAPKPRRFSLRPVATPISPPTPPRNGSPCLSHLRRKSNADRTAPSHYPRDTFLYESPKEPLIQREGAPGVSSPMMPSSNSRRFSLRPMQTGLPATGSVAGGVSSSKAIPRWKAGALQRQIGQMNLRRRARAFSLSDVQSDDNAKSRALSSVTVDATSKRTVNKEPRDIHEPADLPMYVAPVRKSVTLSTPNESHIVNMGERPNESPSADSPISADLSIGRTSFAESPKTLDSATSSRSTINQSIPLSRNKSDRGRDDAGIEIFLDEGNSARTKTSREPMGCEDDTRNRKMTTAAGSGLKIAGDPGIATDNENASSTFVSQESKSTVSVDSYEPLLEIKVQKPTAGPT